MEKLDYLIKYLADENTRINVESHPSTTLEKQRLYHALVNVRQPNKISDKYLESEDEYLQYLLSRKGVTKMDDIQTLDETYPDTKIRNSNKMALWRGDITTLEIDAIVNAANSQGLGCFMPLHKCIDNQINTYAGIRLRLECNEYMKTINYHLDTGKAFITGAYNLPSDYVIHTVGPIISTNVTDDDEKLLCDCYVNSLELSRKHDIKNLAFCSISTGEFGYPKTDACRSVLKCVDDYLDKHYDDFDRIVFDVFDEEDVMIYERYIREYK